MQKKGAKKMKQFEVETNVEGIATLEGCEVVDYDPSKGQITLENPENDWSKKTTDGVGGEE